MATRVVATVIASAIGALVSLLVERSWKRYKASQKHEQGQH
jgi:hypothetical protein